MTPTLLHDDDIRTQHATAPGPAPATDQPVDAAGCPVCPHPMAEHDAIAQRYCRATHSGGLDRGCACG